MSRKMTIIDSITLTNKIDEYIDEKKMEGVREKTLATYQQKLHAIFKHTDMNTEFNEVDWRAVITDIRGRSLSDTSKYSYLKQLKIFINWSGTRFQFPKLKEPDTIKDVYTDEDIRKLIAKPKSNSFTEYCTWCAILLLVDTGMRARSLRELKKEDIDLNTGVVNIRHTKTGKVQVLPISITTKNALKTLWKSSDEEYAIPDSYGRKMTENCFRLRVERYNRARGVEKTSIHLFRHYFAKTFIMNGGSAILLQRYLGHSDISMSAHYADIYSTDLISAFESPVERVKQEHKKIIK